VAVERGAEEMSIEAMKQEPVDWDLSNSATIQRARNAVKLIAERNQLVWNETDRKTVDAINALISFAVVQFHQANTAPREWVGLHEHELQVVDFNDPERGKLARAVEAKLKERNR
jgi:hypothetical protein